MAYNSRFLILPWVKVPHLASHLLGIMARNISKDWESIYNHPIFFLEIFVDTERFLGTCYKAANWIYLGDTTGRGKDEKFHKKTPFHQGSLGISLNKRFSFIYDYGIKKLEQIKLDLDDVDAFLKRVETGHLQDGDYEIIKSLAETVVFLNQALDK